MGVYADDLRRVTLLGGLERVIPARWAMDTPSSKPVTFRVAERQGK